MKTLGLLLVATAAHAGTPVDRPEAFEVDREAPPPGQGEFSFDGGGPIGPGPVPGLHWAASLQVLYLDRPMSLKTTELERFPVRRRETLALGGALSIGSSIVVDARMPMAHQVGDRLNDLGDERPLDNFVLGDLGIGVRLRIAAREYFSVFTRGHVTFGTGDDHDFAGEARFTIAWMLIGRFTPHDDWVIGANAGVRFRGAEVKVADRLLGDELFANVGATYALPAWPGVWCEANHMRAAAELVGVLGNNVAGELGPSPVEARLGFIGQVRSWFGFAVRVGKGLDDHIGAPRFRAMFELIYEPE